MRRGREDATTTRPAASLSLCRGRGSTHADDEDDADDGRRTRMIRKNTPCVPPWPPPRTPTPHVRHLCRKSSARARKARRRSSRACARCAGAWKSILPSVVDRGVAVPVSVSDCRHRCRQALAARRNTTGVASRRAAPLRGGEVVLSPLPCRRCPVAVVLSPWLFSPTRSTTDSPRARAPPHRGATHTAIPSSRRLPRAAHAVMHARLSSKRPTAEAEGLPAVRLPRAVASFCSGVERNACVRACMRACML